MAYPYSRTIVEAIKTALAAIGTDSDDNTASNYAERLDWLTGPNAQRSAHEIRVVRKRKTREEGWLVYLSIQIRSKLSVDTAMGAATIDEQLDNFSHDIHRALSPLEDSLQSTIEEMDSTAFHEEEPNSPSIGWITDITFGYLVDRLTHAIDGPGE